MKLTSSRKAVAAAQEQAQVLKNKAKQAGRAARAAKEKVREAKRMHKLAKGEANQARKEAKAAKRALAEVERASEAVAEVARVESQTEKARGKTRPTRGEPVKRHRPPARKRVSAKRDPGPAAPKADIVKYWGEKTVPAKPVMESSLVPTLPRPVSADSATPVQGDIAPGHAPGEAPAGSSPQSESSTVPDEVTNS